MSSSQLVMVDTSVWVNFFRRRNSKEFKILNEMLNFNLVVTCASIRTEVISGASTKTEFDHLKNLFEAFIFLEPPNNIWEYVEESRFLLARKGVQSSIIDLWIAATAYFHKVMLWTLDKDFQHIKKIIPVKLYS